MLDEYFEEQMKEIIRMCSHHRQTMLFSATMTDEVKDLASVSLKNPVRIFVNSNTDVAPFLRQEFIRIRPNREGDREAIVAGEGSGLDWAGWVSALRLPPSPRPPAHMVPLPVT